MSAARSVTRDNPLSVIGPLFGFCVTFWAFNLVSFLGTPAADHLRMLWSSEAITSALTLVSGWLFLIDLLCIIWWYASYIYPVEPTATFWTHFVDFSVCGMFAIAANAWDKPGPFLASTMLGSSLLLIRFFMVYHGGDATGTDKKILLRAGAGLLAAIAVVSVTTLLLTVALAIEQPSDAWIAVSKERFNNLVLPAVPGLLSSIGIFLTIWLRHKIAIAAHIHECRRQRFVPMQIQWPPPLRPETQRLIRDRTRAGLHAFEDVFRGGAGKPEHERLLRRLSQNLDTCGVCKIWHVDTHG